MKIKVALLSLAGFFFFLAACQNDAAKKESTAAEDVVYLEKGISIAGATFSVLSGQLQKALKEGGVANAVQYCNLAAMPLVDSLSRVHQAQIRRTSTKVRNPEDQPTLEEKLMLEDYAKKAREGKALQPVVRTIDDNTVAFYAPIMTVAFCLQCHGKVGETLKSEDYALIQQLYPDDQAIGYEEGNLRGRWSIQFGTADGGR